MSDFHEVLFPTDISYGSSGGPKWKTAVWGADSGFEARVQAWESVRAEYDVSFGVQSEAQAETLTSFFMNRQGRAYAFRFKDWNDYALDNTHLGDGDYTTIRWQVRKFYSTTSPGGESFTMERPLKKLEWGSETGVKIDGVALTKNPFADKFYGVDYNNGIISFNEPQRGGVYSGTAQSTPFDLKTEAEGGLSSGYTSAGLVFGSFNYDAAAGFAYLNGQFAGPFGADKGLRKIDVSTGEEVLQRSAVSIGGPHTNLSAIICVDTEGYIYVNAGGASNGQPIVKIDGANLSYVMSWGFNNSDLTSLNTSHLAGGPGVVSLDNQLFLHHDLFGVVRLHSCETLTGLAECVNGGSSQTRIALCPYKESAFAIAWEKRNDPDHACRLYLRLRTVGIETFAWGGPNAFPVSAHFDQKTGGVLLIWSGDEEGGTGQDYADRWAGLWHEAADGFVWRRALPRELSNITTNQQVPLNGEMFWVSLNNYFGNRLWRLDTETGLLETRLSATAGTDQFFDPVRRIIGYCFGTTISGGNPLGLISTNLDGLGFTPPERITVDHIEYHVGVRFDTDHLNIKHDFWTYRSWDSIPLVEVRNWDDLEVD